MPTAIEAVDLGADAAFYAVVAEDALEYIPLPPDPGPGDPETEPPEPSVTVWAAPRQGLRARAILQRTGTHEPIGELHTAIVSEWDEDVDEVPSISCEASTWDPLWEAAAVNTWTYQGRTIHDWDPKGYELLVGLEQEPMAVGVFRQPLDIGGDRVTLDARGPEILWAERPFGRVEQLDLYDGWGDFEQYAIGSEPPGIRKRPDPGETMTAVVVADSGARGGKALEITGGGWIECPHVALEGQDGVGRTAEGSAFGKFATAIPEGTPVVQTRTQRADSLAPSNLDATLAKQGERPGDGSGWSDDPIASGAVMSESSIIHNTWVQLRGDTRGAIRYDVVRLQQGVQSGSLIERPYSWYAYEFLGDVQNEAMGGASWGMARVIDEDTVATAQIQVSHNENNRFEDVMALVTDVEGGCSVHVDPTFTARIRRRRGQVRTDVAFTPDTVLACRWAQDPGAEIDDFIVDTGRGTATSLVTSAVSTPRVDGRHRVTKIVRVPSNWSLNRIDAYAARQAAPAALPNRTCELDVPWAYGRRVACGDSLPVMLVDGRLAMAEASMRVMNKRYKPAEGIITFTMGASDR